MEERGGNFFIPAGRHAKRVFWAVVVGGVAILVLLRYVGVPLVFGTRTPEVGDALNDTFESMLSTVLAATLLSGLVLYLTTPTTKSTDLRVLHPKDIKPTLDNGRGSTRQWRFLGNTGRYIRAAVLPRLSEEARRTSSRRDVRIQVLDPRDEQLCRQYAEYRRALRTGAKGAAWDADRVREYVCSTILAAYVWRAEQPLLAVEVVLRRVSSTLRYDITDEFAVVTKEDPQEPALAATAGGFYYDFFADDFEHQMNQGTRLSDQVTGPRKDAVTVAAARKLFAELDLAAALPRRDDAVQQMIDIALGSDHPYA